MIDTFGIPLAFVIIAALTLWVVLGCKGYWWLKLVMVSLSIFFSISLWNSLVSLQGWPTSQTMPEKFEVKWLDVKEPNKKTGEEGCIYVWARDIEPNKPDSSIGAAAPLSVQLHTKEESGEPRLYKLPYSRGMHEQAEGIKEMIGKGGRFYGRLAQAGEAGEGGMSQLGADGKGSGKGKGRPGQGKPNGEGGGSLSEGQEFVFHELPPPLFPNKEPSPSP
jgi:hypothetical protein